MLRTNNQALAEQYFVKEIALHPSNVDAHYNLGLYYKLTGRADQAVPHWERAIEVDPYFAPAYRELALYYQNHGNIAAATSYLERLKALGSRPRH